ncbi:MAG: HEAT repeat domain-containing protein, partial [Planctomycetota bacterium]|nr:HEAT repeat domain-containing protein [Planctomycetota bacterium]
MLTAEDTTTEQVPQWKVEGLLSALDDPILEVQAEAWSRFAYLRGVYVNRLRYRPFPGEGVRYTFSESAMARFQSRLHSLVKLADHQSSYVRSAAARALGTLGEAAKSQVPRIGELLKDEDSSVRSAAAEALGALGEAAKSEAPEIGELLKDEDSYVRSAAAEALGALGEAAKSEAPKIVQLLKDESSYVRSAAAQALGALGEAAKSEAPKIGELLKDEDYTVRSAAALALGALGEAAKSEAPKIVQLLKDEGQHVRAAAAEALGALGEAAKSEAPKIGELLKDEDLDVKYAAAEALGALGEAAKSEASKIGELLKDDQEHPLLTAATFARLDVRYAATMNLERIAPLQAGVTQLWILNPIHRDFSRRGKLRFLCHFISASNQDLSRHGGDENEKQNKVKIWLRYLGKPGEYTDNPSGPTARRHLQALLDAWQASDAAKTSLRDIRKECAEAMAGLAGKVIGTVGPDGKDLSLPRFLQFVYTLRNEKELLRQAKLLEGVQTVLASAEAEGEAIENAQSRVSQELRLLRSRLVILKRLEQGITTVLIHGGFWALLIFVYPSSTMVQALFFWNPWVRRTVGFPYVGLLLTWVPFLRQRLLSPFRET